MSLESHNKNDLSDIIAPEVEVVVYYQRQPNTELKHLVGSVESHQNQQVLLSVEEPAWLESAYIARCSNWDENYTVCRRDWRKLGKVHLLTVDSQPVYYPTNFVQ